MKKMLVVGAMMLAGGLAAVAQDAVAAGQGALASARAQIDKIIETPDQMKAAISGLSAEDQKQFVADVNKAIGDMPASIEEKAAKYLNVNHAALTSAKKGNLSSLIAEVFATVPPEALTLLNERFATDLLNRSAGQNASLSDDQFTNVCFEIVKKVNERVEESDNPSTRSAFAILMLVRASNGTPANLADMLIDALKNDGAKELAKTEWIPSALGQDGREQSYEPILASADAGRRPDFAQSLAIAGPQYLDAVLHDVVGKNTDPYSFIRTHAPVLDASENQMLHQVPTLDDEPASLDVIPAVRRRPQPQPQPHPQPYQGTSF